MIGLQTTSDIVCKECSTELDFKRVQLGLYTCIECSDTQKYSAHVVYPHKTGAIVQPVQEDIDTIEDVLGNPTDNLLEQTAEEYYAMKAELAYGI